MASPARSMVLCVLEFVPQSELHDAGLRQQTAVSAEGVLRLQQGRNGRSQPLVVEADQVQHVEHLPGELQTLVLEGLPALAQAQIQTSVAVAAQDIARAASARQRNGKILLRGGRIGKKSYRAIRLPENARLGGR